MKRIHLILFLTLGTFIVMGLFSGLFGNDKGQKAKDFPPVPEWEPKIDPQIDEIIARFVYYTDGKKDFVVLKNGTCVIVTDGLSDDQAGKEALETVGKIFNYHPDMNPLDMDDGNILVQYNHPAYNVVLDKVAQENIDVIKKMHQKALARDEVLITPLGQNKFDEFGMKALFGRCYFFMDAKNPKILKIVCNFRLSYCVSLV